jgi:hypothetical protein
MMSERPLHDTLVEIDGWNADTGAWEKGVSIQAAGPENIQLVDAPSYTDDWELVGEDVITISANSLSGISLDNWYKVTTTYTAAVKYEGMTLAACRNLYNSLNSQNNGWYLTSNPWVLSAHQVDDAWKIEWLQDFDTTVYQCLNRATMQRTGGKMWSVELQLQAKKEKMMKSGSSVTHSWPGVWSRVPGMYKFL